MGTDGKITIAADPREERDEQPLDSRKRVRAAAANGKVAIAPVPFEAQVARPRDSRNAAPARPANGKALLSSNPFEARTMPRARIAAERSEPSRPESVRILDLRVDRVTNQDVLRMVDGYVKSRIPRQVVTVNVDFCMIAKTDPRFRDAVNEAALRVADGVPLLWASRLLRSPLPERVNGTNLVHALCREGQTKRYRFFLLGAEEQVSERAAAVLSDTYPGIEIAGRYSPPYGPFSDEENERMVRMIRESEADILLVAMGAPAAQVWIAEHLEACRVPVAVGIGGALDFVAGKYKRAPVWMQNHGLEWLFRLCVDFRRLWRRYLLRDMKFIPAVLLQFVKEMGGAKSDLPAPSLNRGGYGKQTLGKQTIALMPSAGNQTFPGKSK